MSSTSAPERVQRPVSDESEESWACTSELERRLEAHLLIARRVPRQRLVADAS